MFSWKSSHNGTPDHPMSSMSEARKLLADLPKEDALKALDEVTSWLVSVSETPNFDVKLRLDLIMLLDETGQPFHTQLLKDYLSTPHLQDFQGIHLWKGFHNFSKELVTAYEVCLTACKAEGSLPADLRERLPLLCIRLLRTAAEQMKLELIRYIDVGHALWEYMYLCYSYAESTNIAETMVYPYEGHAIHTSVQREFVRALVLHESYPASMAPDQIEVAFRIAGRMASLFDFTPRPDANSEYYIDLTIPGPPKLSKEIPDITPTLRFFGAMRALPKLDEIIKQHEHGTLTGDERRFGSEFTPGGKLTVLKHLRVYWDKEHPHRLAERRAISALIEVTHSFQVISKLVTRLDLDQLTGLSSKDVAALKQRSSIGLVAQEDADYLAETWSVIDLSVNGIGGLIPRAGGSWVKIGDLCGIKPQHSQLWWVGVIRRLHTDEKNLINVGIEILAKKPLSIWLRVLGKGVERVSNWESSSGSFKYDYLPAILLPDAHNSYQHATMLLESGVFQPDTLYEVMLGEKSREIRITGLLAQEEDYDWVTFQWLSAKHG